MTTTDILTDMVLVESEKTATIHAPLERVDIADWLLHLPDAEYKRCAPPDQCSTTWPRYMNPTTAGWCRSATCRHRPAGRRSIHQYFLSARSDGPVSMGRCTRFHTAAHDRVVARLCSLPASQDLASVWRSLLAVMSGVLHIMVIHTIFTRSSSKRPRSSMATRWCPTEHPISARCSRQTGSPLKNLTERLQECRCRVAEHLVGVSAAA